MATILIYTSPARGHLFPVLGTALELQSRGHTIHVRTLSPEIERVRALGLSAEPIAEEVEAREMDDWKGKNPIQALQRTMITFGDRALMEIDDVQKALQRTGANALLVDTNCWGAQAVAESSGLPWAIFQPYFTPLPAPGIPPFGPGLARSTSIFGRIRDGIVGKMIYSKMDRGPLPAINEARQRVGLDPLDSMFALLRRPPRVLYMTAKELEYPRDRWPGQFRFVGPSDWSPATETPDWLSDIDRPIVLATCSTEPQNDRAIVESALQHLPQDGYFLVATSAAYDPETFEISDPNNARLERFLPHDPIVDRAAVVVCHGGMGITQRALSRGVPVVIIPFGRDQIEVARRVENAGAGMRLMPKKLNGRTLSTAVREARDLKDGAERIARAFRNAGGDHAAADCFEELLGQPAASSGITSETLSA